MNKPTTLVVDCVGILNHLYIAIANPALPTMDIDAFLALVVDCMIHRQTYVTEIYCLCSLMSNDSGDIFDLKSEQITPECSLAINAVTRCSTQLAHHLYQRIICYGLYDGDFFKYEFVRIINNDNILLRRV